MTLFREIALIPTNRIHPNEWNPNEQTDETFNKLCEEIDEDGFDQPINVCPWPDYPEADSDDHEVLFKDKEGNPKGCSHFKIIGGEHRYRYCVLRDMDFIPCIVNDEWDDQTQKLKTVRRNLLTGHLNPKKFTELVKSLEHVIDPTSMPVAMGFDSEADFQKFVIMTKEKADKTFLDGLVEETKKEKYAVDTLTDIIAEIFSQTVETLDQNYMFFAHKGKNHVAVLCDNESFKSVQDMVRHVSETGGTITDFLIRAINRQLE